jgi:hypothetical protein
MASGRLAQLQLEIVLLGVFSASWLAAIVVLLGLVPVSGTLHLDLYSLYSVAAFLGWISGNVYLHRLGRLPAGRYRKRLLSSYLLGPPSVLYILRALAPKAVQNAAPLVPLYAFVVYCLFFLVPVTLRSTRTPRRGRS